MPDELIDIYDENMNLLGQATKSQAHREGLWHRTFHCWIIKKSPDGRPLVWLQLRGKHKEQYPNLLDISSAGHLRTGETPKDGIREIEKELGLKIDVDKLTKIFTRRLTLDIPGIINREFCATYLLETDKKLSDLVMQPEEVDGIAEADVEDMINLFNGKVKNIYISGLMRNDDGTISPRSGAVTVNELGPHAHDYYLKVMNTVKRYFAGQKQFDED